MKTKFLCLFPLALSLVSCVSVEKAAPPVGLLSMTAAVKNNSQLTCGREIYIGKCTKCHSVEPIAEHSISDWKEDILPTMVKKSKLNAEDAKALEAYVMAVCTSSKTS